MRRLLLALASTAAGLAAVLSYKSHGSPAAAAAVAATTGTQGGSTGTSPPAGAAAATAGTASGTRLAGSASAAPAPTPAPRGTAAAARTITGAVASTQYGPMQVQVTLLGDTITAIKVLQHTDTGTESQQIDATAIPRLTMETLAAQSARIDAVSGASYTSAGYIQSLQSALDKAATMVRSG